MTRARCAVQPPSPYDALIAAWNFLDGGISPTFGAFPMTFVRAGATRTRVNPAGRIEIVPANTPRFDYDPVTLAIKGLLMEEARTNVLLRSAEFDNAAWASQGTPIVTADVEIAPDGSASADRIEDNEAGATSGRRQDVVVANDSVMRVASVFIKKTGAQAHWAAISLLYTGGTQVSTAVPLNTNTGALGATTGSTTATVQDFGDYWRVTLTATNNSTGNTTLRVTVYPAWNNDGSANNVNAAVGSNIFWGAQIEVGGFASSYIPTAGAAGVGALDDCSVAIALIPGFNQNALALVLEALSGPGNSPVGNYALGLSLHDGTANERHWVGRTNLDVVNGHTADGGVTQASIGAASWPINTIGKAAYGAALNDFAVSFNGGAVVTDVAGTMPTVTTLQIGGYLTTSFNGHIRRGRLYNKRPSNSELMAA